MGKKDKGPAYKPLNSMMNQGKGVSPSEKSDDLRVAMNQGKSPSCDEYDMGKNPRLRKMMDQ